MTPDEINALEREFHAQLRRYCDEKTKEAFEAVFNLAESATWLRQLCGEAADRLSGCYDAQYFGDEEKQLVANLRAASKGDAVTADPIPS